MPGHDSNKNSDKPHLWTGYNPQGFGLRLPALNGAPIAPT